jgi:hypothetical protein
MKNKIKKCRKGIIHNSILSVCYSLDPECPLKAHVLKTWPSFLLLLGNDGIFKG